MHILNNQAKIKKLDQQNCYGSVVQLPKQCLHAWEDGQKFSVPKSYLKVNKLLMTGMGGSGLGARVIESVFSNQLKIPLIRHNDYHLPSWVDKQTLVICSSFSGTTEETVSNALSAVKKGCPWMAISTGGTLHDLALKHQVPSLKINPVYNPSRQPRLAIGYSVIGQLIMASKAKIISLTKKDLDYAVKIMNQVIAKNKLSINSSKNPAKKMALKFKQKEIIFTSSGHLTGSAHTVKNQMNENSKNISFRQDIPELNHHFMEGLKFPETNKKHLLFLFLNSSLYQKRIQQRMDITQKVVQKNQVQTVSWQAKSKTKLSQAFEYIQFGALVNFYLSMLYDINPAPIPWVDYFKKELGQPLGQWK